MAWKAISIKLTSVFFPISILGDYLGEKNDFNEQVLKAFVELHDFTNLILVQALRYGICCVVVHDEIWQF
jgi:Sec7-like guanine-nucleotide exchange factor